jgi:hypothetical protein
MRLTLKKSKSIVGELGSSLCPQHPEAVFTAPTVLPLQGCWGAPAPGFLGCSYSNDSRRPHPLDIQEPRLSHCRYECWAPSPQVPGSPHNICCSLRLVWFSVQAKSKEGPRAVRWHSREHMRGSAYLILQVVQLSPMLLSNYHVSVFRIRWLGWACRVS